MSENSTSVYENTTASPVETSHGLAIGLTLSIIVVVVVAIAVILWFRLRKSVDIEGSNKLKTENKVHVENPRESPYSGYAGGHQPAVPHNPIYENFQMGQNARQEFQRSAVQHEDPHGAHEVYLQCDPNDAIYSNDPAFYQPDPECSEDLYIMPDA